VISSTTGAQIVFDGGCTVTAGRGVPGVTIQKFGSATVNTGLQLGGKVTLRGVKVVGFGGYGVDVTGNGNVLLCNWIGTSDGNNAAANGQGVRLAGNNHRLGEAGNAASGNLFSGNTGVGLLVASGTHESHYSWVGLQANGTDGLRNGQRGVVVELGAKLIMGLGNKIRG
jgi:hypothetical protein